MNRIRTILLAALLALSCIGCTAAPEQSGSAAETPAPTAEPTATPVPTATPTPTPAPTPEGEPGVVCANGTGVIIALLPRGYALTITGESGDYYNVMLSDGREALVEKRFVRPDADAEYEIWKGFSKANAQVYATAYMTGEPMATLKLNTKIVVLDIVGNRLLIAWDGDQGYTLATKISKYRVNTAPSGGGGGGDYGGGGGGGGGSADGDDIVLSALYAQFSSALRRELLFAAATPSPEPTPLALPCPGTVIAKDAEAYLALLDRGDAVYVTEQDDAYYTVYSDGETGRIPRKLARMESDAPYAEWDGFTDNRAPLYSDYRMNTEIKKMNRNTVVRVLGDMVDCYLVETEDGEQGFILLKQVKDKRFSAPVTSGGGGGGGDYGGGGGGGGGGGPEWTDPVL